jgi:hypothetical protein
MLISQNIFKRKSKTHSVPSQLSDLAVSRERTVAGASTSSLPARPIGLRVLHQPNTESTNVNAVNIIFVHGLGGSARETWTHYPSKTFWPTLLYEDDRFANARISTFGYDANFKNIFATTNALGITDFAGQLLDALDLHYDQYGDVNIADIIRLILDSYDLCCT